MTTHDIIDNRNEKLDDLLQLGGGGFFAAFSPRGRLRGSVLSFHVWELPQSS
jgi:hypothetical protein